MDLMVIWLGHVRNACFFFANSKINDRFENGKILPCSERILDCEEPIPIYILGDPAFPLLFYRMKEYANGWSTVQEQYSGLSLSEARTVIEGAFGSPKAWFGTLKRALDINTDDLPFVIYACFVLHNYFESTKDILDDNSITEAIQHDRDNQLNSQPGVRGNSLTAEGKRMRRVLT